MEKKLVTALFTYSHRVECHQIRRICDIIWDLHRFCAPLCVWRLFFISLSLSFSSVVAIVRLYVCLVHNSEPRSKQASNAQTPMIKRYMYKANHPTLNIIAQRWQQQQQNPRNWSEKKVNRICWQTNGGRKEGLEKKNTRKCNHP